MPTTIETLAVEIVALRDKLDSAIKGGVKDAKQELGKVEKPIVLKAKTGGFVSSISKAVGKATKLMAIGGVAAAAAFGFAAVKGAADFEAGMREINTLLGESEEEFQALSKDVLNLSKDLGIDAVESTKALYQAISAGVPKENALTFMEIAAKAAIGGVTDTMTAVDGLTTVLNAFKIPASEAEHVADVMFTTVKQGKCVVGSTRVLLADGRYERIDALQKGGSVVSFDGRTFQVMDAEWIDQGVKETVKVRTRLGREITTTWNHPYLTKRKDDDYRSTQAPEWRKVSELRIGDQIAVPTALPYFGQESVPEHEAAFLGLWLAEGSGNSGSPKISTTRYGDKVAEIAAKYGCETNNIEKREDHCPTYQIVAGRRGSGNENKALLALRNYDLEGCAAGDKHIPDAVFTWDRTSIATLLQWLFNGDGWLTDVRALNRSGFEVGFVSKSERLVRDVSHLLLRFGIVGRVRNRNNCFVWETSRYAEVERFVRFIGIDRPAAAKVLEHSPKKQRAMRGVVEFDPIVAIEAAGQEHVYDLTVEQLHNFIANDIVAHNTTFDELAASMFQVAPMAAAANVAFEEVSAALATLTKQGTPTRVATTQLRASIQGLLKPSEEMDEIFQALGFDSAAMALEAKGLQFSLNAVRDATDGDVGAMTKLLGSIEATNAALGITGPNAETFAADFAAIGDAAGASQKAFEEMDRGFKRSVQRLMASINFIRISVGSRLLPPLATAATWVAKRLPDGFERLSKFITKFSKIAKKILLPPLTLVLKAFKDLLKWFKDMVSPAKRIQQLLDHFSVPLANLALALGLSEDAFAELDNIWKTLTKSGNDLIQGVLDYFSVPLANLALALGYTEDAFSDLAITWETLTDIAGRVVSVIQDVIKYFLELAIAVGKEVFADAFELFRWFWKEILTPLAGVVGDLLGKLGFLGGAFEGIKGPNPDTVRLLATLLEIWLGFLAVKKIVTLTQNIVRTGAAFLRKVGDWGHTITQTVKTIGTFIKRAFDWTQTITQNIVRTGAKLVTDFADKTQTITQKIVGKIAVPTPVGLLASIAAGFTGGLGLAFGKALLATSFVTAIAGAIGAAFVAAAGAITAPVWAVVAAVIAVALAVPLIIIFRKQIWKFLSETLPQLFVAGFQKVKEVLGPFFSDTLPRFFSDGFSKAKEILDTFFTETLPQTIMAGLRAIPGLLAEGLRDLPRLLGRIIGFMVAAMLVLWIVLPIRMAQLLIKGIKKVLPLMLKAFLTIVVGAWKILSKLATLFFKMVVGLAELIGKAAVGIYKAFRFLVLTIIGFFADLPERIITFFLDLQQRLNRIWGAILSFIGDVAKKIPSFFADLPGRIADFFKLLPGLIADIFTKEIPDFFKALPSFFGDAVAKIPDLFKAVFVKLPKLVWGWLKKVWDMVKKTPVGKAIKFIWDQIKKGFKEGWEFVDKLTGRALTDLVNFIRNTWQKFKDAAKWLISKLWEGIQAAWTTVTTWAKNVGSEIAGFIKSAFWAVWAAGVWLVTTIWDGIQEIWGWFTTTISALFDSITTWLPDLWNVGQEVIRSLWNGMKSFWDSVAWPWLTGIMSRIKSAFSFIPGVGERGATVGPTATVDIAGLETLFGYVRGGTVGLAQFGARVTSGLRDFLVGEAGPELVRLPVGSRIFPRPSAAPAGVGGGFPSIEVNQTHNWNAEISEGQKQSLKDETRLATLEGINDALGERLTGRSD